MNYPRVAGVSLKDPRTVQAVAGEIVKKSPSPEAPSLVAADAVDALNKYEETGDVDWRERSRGLMWLADELARLLDVVPPEQVAALRERFAAMR